MLFRAGLPNPRLPPIFPQVIVNVCHGARECIHPASLPFVVSVVSEGHSRIAHNSLTPCLVLVSGLMESEPVHIDIPKARSTGVPTVESPPYWHQLARPDPSITRMHPATALLSQTQTGRA